MTEALITLWRRKWLKCSVGENSRLKFQIVEMGTEDIWWANIVGRIFNNESIRVISRLNIKNHPTKNMSMASIL